MTAARVLLCALAVPLAILPTLRAMADGRADGAADDPIGYEALRERLGDALPTGGGVVVAQVEPPSRIGGEDKSSTRRTHIPDRSKRVFRGVRFLNVEEDALDGSGHANATAVHFYGRGRSSSPGVDRVHLYTTNAFLRGLTRAGDLAPARVWNHSWIGELGPGDRALLRAFDAAAVRYNWVVAAGVANNGANLPLLASAFNVLAVGRSDGQHAVGAAATDSVYTTHRTRPHLVAPAGTTSAAAPMVASAATLLVDALAQRRIQLARDGVVIPTTGTADGRTFASFEQAYLVRAALMAGARRQFDRGASPAARAQPDYRADRSVQTDNGLDTRFGAGQLDVNNAYRIIEADETDSRQRGHNEALAGDAGFDVDLRFGREDIPLRVAHYRLAPVSDAMLTVALVWPWQPAAGGRPANLDLRVSRMGETLSPVARSESNGDTSEHLRVRLKAGERYQLSVVQRDGASAPYALAWRLD